jgi:hypothetical protein
MSRNELKSEAGTFFFFWINPFLLHQNEAAITLASSFHSVSALSAAALTGLFALLWALRGWRTA